MNTNSSWLDAWEVVEKVFSYTNHTLDERSAGNLAGRHDWASILPRHLQLIFEINDHFLKHGTASGTGR
jgi:starch phosphorylase